MRLDSQQNRTALGKSYVNQQEVSGGLPVYLVIESTSICNLRCIMCPYPNMGRKHQHMSMSVYEKIVTEAAGFVEFVWLHLFGEPLLNPNIYQMINLAEEAGIRTGLSTNATRLDEQASAALLDSKLSLLLLCLDGAAKSTFEQIRVGANFETVRANIARFAEMKRGRKSELKAALQMIHMKANEGEEQLFYKEWQDKGFDSVLCKPFHVWANQDKHLIQIEEKQSPPPAGACYEPWVGCTVLADGTVVPCCNDYAGKMRLGDLKTQSLRDIWNGPEMRRLRRRFIGATPDLAGTICAECPFPVARTLDAETGSGPFDPIVEQFTVYLTSTQQMPRLAPTDPHLVQTTVKAPAIRIRPGQAFTCEVDLLNRSPWPLRSTGSTPVHLSYHWLDDAGSCVTFDGQRTPLVPELPGGGQCTYRAQVIAPDRPGQFILHVCPVQEQVAWFEEWDPRNTSRCLVVVENV